MQIVKRDKVSTWCNSRALRIPMWSLQKSKRFSSSNTRIERTKRNSRNVYMTLAYIMEDVAPKALSLPLMRLRNIKPEWNVIKIFSRYKRYFQLIINKYNFYYCLIQNYSVLFLLFLYSLLKLWNVLISSEDLPFLKIRFTFKTK